ncbi:MAG: DNA repair protein RadC [Oscillospiraceae bacterium]|nr:DNA repair protein RadC [Oscillospiraceae bacterium]
MENEHEGHRMRLKARFMKYGLDSFDDHNVLELLLFYALPRRDTNLLAHDLLKTFGSLAGVFDATPDALMTVKGVGENTAGLIHLVPEAARRYLISKAEPGDILADSEAAGRYLVPLFFNCKNETVYMLCLNAAMKLLDCRALGQGGVDAANVSIRQIVQLALSQNAAAVILAHNHTCGIAVPSQEDLTSTLRIRDTLSMVGVTLADHIIVAGEDFISMADSGFLDKSL